MIGTRMVDVFVGIEDLGLGQRSAGYKYQDKQPPHGSTDAQGGSSVLLKVLS